MINDVGLINKGKIFVRMDISIVTVADFGCLESAAARGAEYVIRCPTHAKLLIVGRLEFAWRGIVTL